MFEKRRSVDVYFRAGERDEIEAARAIEVPSLNVGRGYLPGEVAAEDLDEHRVRREDGDGPFGLESLGRRGSGLPLGKEVLLLCMRAYRGGKCEGEQK